MSSRASAALAIGAEVLGERRQRFRDAVHGFVENERAAFVLELTQALRARAAAARQESLEHETIGRKTGGAERDDRRARARHGHDVEARLARRAHQAPARIADQRRARVAHERDALPASELARAARLCASPRYARDTQ